MKKFFFLLAATLLIVACSQKQSVVINAVSTEGLNTIDVEKLMEPIDLEMDISQLSVSDLYILRHAFAARRGYPFRDAYLRRIYETTSWYDSLMWAFDEKEDNFKHLEYGEDDNWRDYYYKNIKDELLQYTDEEQAFIDRVKAREEELLALNFSTPENYRVVLRNILNARQMSDIDTALADRLGKNGFAIVPAQNLQLFHVYERNDYHQFPSFVTTDIFLQLYHLYFDATLREVEQTKLAGEAYRLIRDMRLNIRYDWQTASDQEYGQLARHNEQYLSIAEHLLTGQETIDPTDKGFVEDEIKKVMAAENNFSEFIGDYKEVLFPYSLFRPRGHYTRNDALKRYFRTMMWLQSVPFGLDDKEQTAQALIMANELNRNEQIRQTYERLNQVLTFLMGQPDDLSLLQVADVLKSQRLSVKDLIKTPGELEKMRRKLNDMAEKQTRLRPKYQRTSKNKICLLPQRYQPDAEVMLEMVDYKGDPTMRPVPQGLDIMAAMGVSSAEKLLVDQQQKWRDFQSTLERMKSRMDSIDWQETIAKQWMHALKVVNDQPTNAPYFMVSPEWQRKQLNASLSSWAELKHDAILYAKQPMGAECGGGGIPEPVLAGYVEPAIDFWMKAVELLGNTNRVLHQYQMLTDRSNSINQRIGELAMFLLNTSQKELQGLPLSGEENDQLQHIGATFENISLELLREGDQYLWEWGDVQGPERSVALIADVYTANADNNPEKSILYAGTGQADEIYVVVEIQGYLYLTRGAVLSYREVQRPLDEQRMNDEEWQQRLEKEPRLGVPEWMQPILVPLKQAPKDNEEVFYSSGC